MFGSFSGCGCFGADCGGIETFSTMQTSHTNIGSADIDHDRYCRREGYIGLVHREGIYM